MNKDSPHWNHLWHWTHANKGSIYICFPKTQQGFVHKIKNLKQLSFLNKPFIHGMQQFVTYIVNHKRKFNHSKLLKASHTCHHNLRCPQNSEKHLHKENLNFKFVPNNSMKSQYIDSHIYKHQEPILMEVLYFHFLHVKSM